MLNLRRVSLLSVLILGFIACCAHFGAGQLAASGFQEAALAPLKASKPEVMPEPPREDSGRVHFKPAGTKPMEKVTLVAVGPEGFVYAGDPGAGRVLRFKPSGELASQFPLQETRSPWTGLAVDRGGTVYVAAGDRLFRYEGGTGKLLGEVRHPDGPGFFHVAPRPDSGVIASWRNPRRDDLVLVDGEGAIETIHRNAVSGATGEPMGDVLVAMDGRRTLYAAVSKLHAVCVFEFTGKYVNRFGSDGAEPGQFSGPFTGLTVDGQQRIFVSDAKGVSIFSDAGRYLRQSEAHGTGLAVSDDDELFAANGTEIVKYSAGEP